MGWNTLHFDNKHSLFDGINDGDHTYFVHSYHLIMDDEINRISYTNYGQKITAAVVKDNMAGTQFHPEKSQAVGLTFIRNFLLWRP
jgi:glutamine amidotransferase